MCKSRKTEKPFQGLEYIRNCDYGKATVLDLKLILEEAVGSTFHLLQQ